MRNDRRGSAARADDRARRVVGLYGDPGSTWGIGLEASFTSPLHEGEVADRVAELIAAYPHLGTSVALHTTAGDPAEHWPRLRADVLSRPYPRGEELVRVAVDPAGGRMLVAAHHGVCDGLGLVAVASVLSGRAINAEARGIGDRRAPQGFAMRSVRRVVEALWRPPPRFRSADDLPLPQHGAPDHVAVAELPHLSGGTAALCAAVAAVFPGPGEPVVIVGASRRPPGQPAPDRQTAYLRFRVPRAASVPEIAVQLRACPPEPDFPETALKGLGPRIAHLLRNRLGATALLSNLGVLTEPDLRSVAMFPASSGPQAVAVGLATTTSSTTLTVRTRAGEFSPNDTEELLRRFVTAFPR